MSHSSAAPGTFNNVGTPLKGAPVTYAIGPKQYLAVQASGRHETREATGSGPWQRLPHSPLARRSGHSVTWTGQEVVVWGGSRPEPSMLATGRTHLRSGAIYDPASDRWRRIAPAPIPPRDEHVAVWTGEELLVWGGRAATFGHAGAAYRPGSGWRLLPEGPLDHVSASGDGTWTGRELLVWAREGGRVQTAFYDPADDAWRAGQALEAEPGAQVDAVWAGDRLAVLVVAPSGAGSLYRYRPEADTWDHVSGHVFAQPEGLAAAGETVVLWGYTSGERFGQHWAAAVDVGTGELRRLPGPSVRLARDHIAESTGSRLLLWDGRRGAMLDLSRDRWTTLPDAPVPPRTQPAGVWTGRELIVWGGGGDRYHADGARLRPPASLARGGGHASE